MDEPRGAACRSPAVALNGLDLWVDPQCTALSELVTCDFELAIDANDGGLRRSKAPGRADRQSGYDPRLRNELDKQEAGLVFNDLVRSLLCLLTICCEAVNVI